MRKMITWPGAAPYWIELGPSDKFQIYPLAIPWRDEPADEEELALLELAGKLATQKRKKH